MAESILNGKRILAVDDEPDVLETLEDLLADYPGLVLDQAGDYDSGFQLLRSWTYDAVILDIMGVRGFDLLNAAVHLGFPAVMLSAHAVSPQSVKKSLELGARAFIPKEKMADIGQFLEDVLTLSHRGSVGRMFDRLGGFFNKKFGSDWQTSEKEFWDLVSSGRYTPEPAILTGGPHPPPKR
jgi:DNA-binding NarL/FixJ family response regulator